MKKKAAGEITSCMTLFGIIPGSKAEVDLRSSTGTCRALSCDELRATVARILAYGVVQESYHSSEERADRRISDDDVQYGLSLSFALAVSPNWDADHKSWEYLIRTVDLDENDLHMKIAVDVECDRIRVITKF